VEAVLAEHPTLLDEIGVAEHDVLVHAAATSNRPAIELMVRLGFPVDVRSEEFAETPLHAAAWYGRADMVALLLDHGADVNAEAGKPFGGTPLDWAERGSRDAEQDVLGDPSAADYPATVERLLAAGGRPTG
jgi:ankyrin repeat protein